MGRYETRLGGRPVRRAARGQARARSTRPSARCAPATSASSRPKRGWTGRASTSGCSRPRAPTRRSRSRTARAGCTSTRSAPTATSQRRSYPTWQGGDGFQAGYERIGALDLDGARRPGQGRGAGAPDGAARAPRGRARSSSTRARSRSRSTSRAATRRSSIASSAARSPLAGGSFLQPQRLGKLRYGSPLVDARRRRDHRGRQRHLRLGRRGRAGGQAAARRSRRLRRLPLEPRDGRGARARVDRDDARRGLEPHAHHPHGQRVARAGRGGLARGPRRRHRRRPLVATDKSWSIDDLRLNFQFSCEIAWEIKRGKRTRILRDPFYTGITPHFWRSCDAVCGARRLAPLGHLDLRQG